MKRFLSLILVLTTSGMYAQTVTTPLSHVLKTQDSLLFEAGFNKCDMAQLEALVSEDFEFYHDQSGMQLSKATFITSIKERVCKLAYKPRRELLDNSLQVHPLEKDGKVYGAVQTGKHQFYATEKDRPEYLTSTATFTHLWLLEQGRWRLSRCFSYDHQEADTANSVNEKLLFKDRSVTEKWLKLKHVPALGIGYIKDGRIASTMIYGSLENGMPYPHNTIFNVASLTKPVTALVALKLVNAGKWNLDEPVYKYWIDPDVLNDPNTKKLTTRHILSHQSGFLNWRSEHRDGKLKFVAVPGTAYEYSGEGFEYLRRALENKFGKTLDQLAKELIFEPLNMHNTFYYWTSAVDEARFAKWYKKDGSLHDIYKNTSVNAADDLLTTLEDYSRFIEHIINGAGLNKELYEEMIFKHSTIKPREYFGLSWIVYEQVNGSENALQHGGDDKGVHTIVFMLPKSKVGLVIFTNCDNGTDVYIPAIQHYLGKAGQEIIDIETQK